MRTIRIRIVIFAAVLVGLALPAHARVTFGVVPGANSLISSESQAIGFAEELQRRLGEEVKIRLFDDEASLHNWLNRFREVDLAVLSQAYIQRQPAGEFFALAENLRAGIPGAAPADPVVARQGLSPQAMRNLQYALYALAADPAARGLIGAPTPPPRPAPAPVANPATPKAAPKPQPRPAPVEKPEVVPAAEPRPQSPVVVSVPAPAQSPAPAVTQPPPAPAATHPAVAPKVKTAPQLDEPAPKPVIAPPTAPLAAPSEAKPPEPRIWIDPGKPAPAVVEPAVEPPSPTAPEATPAGEGRAPIEAYSRNGGVQGSAPRDSGDQSAWFAGGLPLNTLVALLAFTLAGTLFLVLRFRQRQTRDAFTWHATPPGQATGNLPRKGSSSIRAAQRRTSTRASAANVPRGAAPKPAPALQKTAPAAKPTAAPSSAVPGKPKPALPAVPVAVADLRPPHPAPAVPAPASPFPEQTKALPGENNPEPIAAAQSGGASPPAELTQKEAGPQAAPPELAPSVEPPELGLPLASTDEHHEDSFTPLGPDHEVLNRYRNPFAEEGSEDEVMTEETAGSTQQPAHHAPQDAGQLEDPEGSAPAPALEVLDQTPEQTEVEPTEPEAPPVPAETDAGFQETEAIPLETDASQETLALHQDDPVDEAVGDSISLADIEPEAIAGMTLEENGADRQTPSGIELSQDHEPIILETQGAEFTYQDHQESADAATETELPTGAAEQLELESLAEAPIASGEIELPEAPAAEASPDSAAAPLNLEGNVASIQMPALLQLIASQTLPGTLLITTRHDEKRLHFRNGRIALAASVNLANRSKTGFLMNKVGYLLIRQGKITEEQRDRALELCEKQPTQRIGEALVEMGALSHESLLEALRNQAESVIFSLFIFPEGHFRFVFEEYPLRPGDDLALDIRDLLENARRNEAEWANIREAIPSLDAVLDYTPTGREKLGSARMTIHQKLVLSLIDGKRQINEICIAATLLDLEVYKFLYFMVHAKILHKVNRG